jgi:hypothetical protein
MYHKLSVFLRNSGIIKNHCKTVYH